MSEAILRAKMRVAEVRRSINADGQADSEHVRLIAVCGPEGTENGQWAKWTPSATLEITINNQAAFGKLANGHEFFADFIPAKKAETPNS